MKFIKLLCFAALTCIVFSCSPEDSTIINESESNPTFTLKNGSPINLNTAKSYFQTMMTTREYSDYSTALRTFASKMNKNAVLFNSKTEAMSWIASNLSATNFRSVRDFETHLDDVISKQENLMANNTLLYNFLDQASPGEIIEVIRPSLGTPPPAVVATGCSDNCMDSCENSLTQLEVEVGVYSAAAGLNGIMQSLVIAYYWSQFENIVDDLNGCISAC